MKMEISWPPTMTNLIEDEASEAANSDGLRDPTEEQNSKGPELFLKKGPRLTSRRSDRWNE
jgi:hypothetical protein